MDFSSWFRRTLVKNHKPSPTTQTLNKSQIEPEEELGVTDQLQNFLKSLTFETFKNFPLQDDRLDTTSITTSNGSSLNIHKDLSEWQERHATFVLSKCKEISQLRYLLCPRHLKERQFWRIYFALVKSYVSPYEIRAIQKEKLRRMGEDNKPLDSACEVEMAEAKGALTLSSSS
ncbi:Bsd domain-containing protein [Thalictrum thalictroides]|uniref:Bsd domain-containing protein n=1 Tax=Thalictrum thalictroides TaxID=46969 RepID=A0A7J6VTU6_THATH|nr:Bsd domain-containing protein [Thalictrum thalictroides]